ncbi:MAG TPA: polysaccharide deacetylase family protein [Terriglobia bacterium]
MPDVVPADAAPDASAMALLVTDPDSNWQDLWAAFRAAGIPVSVESNVDRALGHRTVFVYPRISGPALSEKAIISLMAHVKEGGKVLTTDVPIERIGDAFGFTQVTDGAPHSRIRGKSLEIGTRGNTRLPFSTSTYRGVKEAAVLFEDGSPAVFENRWGNGTTLVFSFDLGTLSYLAHAGRDESIERPYINGFVSILDPLIALVKRAYRDGDRSAITFGTVPDDRQLAVLMTHDVDYAKSVPNSLTYAREEHRLGVRTTFFVQTKYIQDFNDVAFFGPEQLSIHRQVLEEGMEIGSHSVSHSRQFNKLPEGSGTEKYPSYLPFVKSRTVTQNATVLGELRVSKFLLDSLLPGRRTVSFRSGFLLDPESLPQDLVATGYLYDSSGTAGLSMTHLPFQLTYNRRGRQLLPIYRFPITMGDEAEPVALQPAIDVCERIAESHGICNVLVHPNELGPKLEFAVGFIKHWKSRAWIGTLSQLGEWWAARDRISVSVGDKEIHLQIPSKISGLVLELAPGDIVTAIAPASAGFHQNGDHVTLGPAGGAVTLYRK